MARKDVSNDMLNEAGKAILIQDNQQKKIQSALGDLQTGIDKLSNVNDENLDDLDLLLEMAESMCLDHGIDINNINYDIDNFMNFIIDLNELPNNVLPLGETIFLPALSV